MNNADNLMLKYNCAIALGIIKDKRALPVLREIVKNRSSFFFKDCRRTNQLRSVIAICLLGRFRDIKSIDILSEIVFEKEEYNKLLYHEIKEPLYVFSNVPGFNAVYFQHFTHAVYSLVKIAESHPEIKDDIFER